jgi:fatty acid desaturase
MNNNIPKWHHSPIDKEVFDRLKKRSDFKALAHLLPHLLLVVVLAIISYRSFRELTLYLSIPIYLLYANVFNFLGQSAGIHEMSHGTVFKTKALNKFFINFIGFITWSDHVFYKNSHMKHHQFTAHHGLEKEVVLPMKLRIRDFAYSLIGNPYITYKTLFAYIRRAFGIIKGEWEEEIFPESAPKKRAALIKWNRILIIGHGLIALLIILSGQYLLLLYITYPLFSSSILSQLVTMTQHTGLQADIADSRKCCRSVSLNPVYEFLYWNMNYHIEHHMYAAVPFYNLKKLHKAISKDLPEQKSLFASYKDIIEIQKRQKLEPDYYYDQPCPSRS